MLSKKLAVKESLPQKAKILSGVSMPVKIYLIYG